MSFWNLSNNESAATTAGGVYDSNPDILPIPKDTVVMGACDEAGWDEYEGVQHIKLRWCVLDGDYKNRKIFQKIRVNELDPQKRDKAIRMLAAIDANAGGELGKLGSAPTDQELMSALMSKTMILKLDVWDINGNSGNWVKAVAPVTARAEVEQPKQAAPSGDYDADIGF